MMRAWLLALLQIVLLLFSASSSDVRAQTVPADFKFSITVGGTAPWAEKITISIDSSGQTQYARYTTADTAVVLAESTFTINPANLEQLWKAVQDSNFFTLVSKNDSTVQDGEFEKVTVRANGQSHQVIIRNIAEPKLEGILTTLNAIIPPLLQISYSPPGSLNILPVDPCSVPSGLRTELRHEDFSWIRSSTDTKARRWYYAHTSTASAGTAAVSGARSIAGMRSVTADLDIPHPGTVVAYDVPIQNAVSNHLVTLSSKGEFFGDGVSITVNNTNTPPSNTVSITLYLEFYGPQATQANIDKIELDIAKKWSGLKTSSGKTIDIGFVTRSDVKASSPPATPGYHEIKLVPKGGARSVVTGGPKTNEGTGGGTWALDEPPGTYGHEAGHLMGLPDRYTDFNKQSDGSWVNAKTGQSYPNDNAFANYAATKYPGVPISGIKNVLKSADTYSIPLDGSENDLMANVSKAPLQSDIDQITGNPGVLVTVPPGTVFVNRNAPDQNLVVTHEDDLFVKPGQTRTQNGIYIACIDHFKEIPTSMGRFDLAPPLSEWQGIASARHMDALAHYIDSAGLYCGDAFAAQEAIWRISDNALPLLSTGVDRILHGAGIDVGRELLDFPHMTPGTSNDSTTHPLIPNELFVADITPKFAAGTIGTPTQFTAHVFAPSSAAHMPAWTWNATGPDSSAVTLSAAADSTASFTPARSGIYEVALRFSVADSSSGMRAFASARKSYAIVPDENTETFEHMGLADKFPWTSLGDVPWTISSAQAQTGQFAAEAGSVTSGGQSTLAITLSLPSDSTIRFSVRTALAGFTSLVFSIDSITVDFFFGLTDWQMARYKLTAGKHLLAWSYSSIGDSGSVWLDNIFLPGTALVTAVADRSETVPHAFVLEQNYPNPFNPSTLIRYGLPHRSNVELVIYNTLGQKVAELARGTEEAGYHEVEFDASRFSSGVYFYTLRADEFVQTRKLLLIK